MDVFRKSNIRKAHLSIKLIDGAFFQLAKLQLDFL